MLYQGQTNEYLRIEHLSSENCNVLNEHIESGLTLLWCKDNQTELTIDNVKIQFKKNQILCLTEFHKVDVHTVGEASLIKFNRSLYCILHPDTDISCKGILFFGASQLPILDIGDSDQKKLENLLVVFKEEFNNTDDLQLDMLQLLIKRLLIICTRIYKEQKNYTQLNKLNIDTVREFNFLVETHFKTKHTVACYADLLNKSPKTISNLFAKLDAKTPLQYIQERIMLESRRILRYSDQSIKEIAYELGYDDIQSFSRFFKKNEGISPSEYRKNFY